MKYYEPEPPIAPETLPTARQAECARLRAAEEAAAKAASDAAKIRSDIQSRDNQWRDLCAALASADKQLEVAQWQAAEAQADYDRTTAGLPSLAGNIDGPRALWDACRTKVSLEKVGLEILLEVVKCVPARREAALAELKAFAKEHQIPRELWPAALATD